MPVAESDMPGVVEAIVAKMKLDDLAPIYLKATGVDLIQQHFPPGVKTFSEGVANALKSLNDDNREQRWLITYLLASPKADLPFRRYLALKCGDAVGIGTRLAGEIDTFLGLLTKFAPAMADRAFRNVTRNTAPVADALAQVMALTAYKTMHEALHAPSVALSGARAGDPTIEQLFGDGPTGVAAAARSAATAAGRLVDPDLRAVEDAWIADLARLAADGAAQLAAGLLTDEQLGACRDLITRQLYWLDSRIFVTANDLPLSALLSWTPAELDIEIADGATDWSGLKILRPRLEHAVRNLGPSVLARALVHKLWQEADRELAKFDLMLETSDPEELEAIDDRWRPIRDVVRWFAKLDGPGAAWAANAMELSDGIDDEIAKEAGLSDLKRMIANYRRAVRLRFLAVDGEMKADCLTLARIEKPIKIIMAALP